MLNNIDYQKLFDLKLKGEPDVKALLASGATPSVAKTKFERRHKRIREVIALAQDHWRYNILKGCKSLAKPKQLGARLAKTAMNPKDNFNSTNAIKVLSHIIMRKQEISEIPNSSNIHAQNVFIIPQALSAGEWKERVKGKAIDVEAEKSQSDEVENSE